MPNTKMPVQTWPAYIQAVRDEVRHGVGIFGEDLELRDLIQECFEHGDPLMGTVLSPDEWDQKGWSSSHLAPLINGVR